MGVESCPLVAPHVSSLQPAAPQNNFWPICDSQWNTDLQHWKLQVLTTHVQTKRVRQAKTRLRQPKLTGHWVSHAAHSQQKEILFSFLCSRKNGVFPLSLFSCEFSSEGQHFGGGRGNFRVTNPKDLEAFGGEAVWDCHAAWLGGDRLTDDAGLA